MFARIRSTPTTAAATQISVHREHLRLIPHPSASPPPSTRPPSSVAPPPDQSEQPTIDTAGAIGHGRSALHGSLDLDASMDVNISRVASIVVHTRALFFFPPHQDLDEISGHGALSSPDQEEILQI
ncbi:hypothetical protein NL676_014228 [Syzygium grande]|nr:hypothetical protein NL676_014228 [Syzygium grande]